MTSSLLPVSRRMGLLVTGFLATFGSFALAFGVMTDCTNNYNCGATDCEPCSTANSLITGGWVLQGLLFAVALALWLPPVVKRLRRPTLVTIALVVPMVSVLAFAGVYWAADRSYCQPGQDQGGGENYCDVR